MRRGMLISLFCCLWSVGEAQAQPTDAKQVEFFEARIRPVLIEHCFRCHGEKKQKAGLRLDSRLALLKGSEDGPVVVSGQPEKSPLIQAVRHQGKIKMPPENKLPAQAIADLTTWVQMGLPWPDSGVAKKDPAGDAWKKHWAFQPIRNPAAPRVKNQHVCLGLIDRFIQARLEEKNLSLSPLADRKTLIRRATFDLIGLPPTPEEVAEFESDKSADAFARVVDRLLASPHYGERWGRYWLDVARYADTKGYVFFQESAFPWAYTYRDYVIRSFNEDLPYDRFILEQLAADQHIGPKEADRRPLTAMGFVTLGGRFMNNQYDILDDRIDVVTRGLLGLTVTCARCHDHKYDPIPSKDYYALYGVFASSAEPEVPPLFQPAPKTDVYAKFDKELKVRETKLTDFVQAKHAELVKSARTRAAEYLLAVHALRDQPSTEEFMLIADTGDLNPTMIVRWQAYLERMRKSQSPVWGMWHAFAELPGKEFAAKAAEISGRLQVGRHNPLVAKAFAGKPPTSMKEVAARYSKMLNDVDRRWQAKLDLAKQLGLMPELLEPAAMELLQVFYSPGAPANVPLARFGDLALLPDRASQAKFQELKKALETWRASGAGAPPRAMVLEDLPAPYQPRVFLRGNPNNPGAEVPRRYLSMFDKHPPFQKGSGRLELARAIASRDNPLTARVLVNRVWLHHFGAGLVRTPADFGLRSDPPSHPELLDHLATTFMDDGWSIKKLHRRIMLSQAYQQKSDDRPECLAADPDNRLLWKMNRRRLDFEAMRDALLAVGGKLDRRIGGPSVSNITAPGSTRRTLYGHLDRLNLPGLYRTFDFPSPDATSAQRDLTTVPQQALFMMNNPFVLECA
ncbi:MAG TPA: PSD1 and planctomycete cytochrome C domain-containing protein, partial [Gemmataceae bacterium]|nr:PSD1 and planctomycete cytochrome C domain-containing protein [Gemmataceae bacterium]